MPLIQVGNRHLYYSYSGHGPEPVLLVHGGFATGRWWAPVAQLLPPEAYTCYLPDLPGSGRSDDPGDPAGYAVEAIARDLAVMVDTLGLNHVHLAGHSLGAAVALTLAVARPQQLRSLVLVSTPSPEGTSTPDEGYELLQQMRTDRALLTQGLATIMPARAPDAFFQQLVDDALAQAPAAFTESARALADWRLPREALAHLRLPVLLIWGDRDHIVERDVQRQLLLSIPGANNLEVFRGVGHSPMLERPEGFVQALRDFLEQDFDEYVAIRQQAE